MLDGLRGNQRNAIRDRAMFLLLATYGLRFSEIRELFLSDVDEATATVTVRRLKGGGVHRYPLSADVKLAIRKYIRHVRPKCKCPNLFVRFITPYQPLSHGAVYERTAKAFKTFGIRSVGRGPHAFRHACADRLLKEGASVSEIAAYLGHRNLRSLRGYIQPGIDDLRPIADFSLEGLM
jgi:integrase/recombinase XerD